MRKWNNLNENERTRAVNKVLDKLLEAVVEGAIRFDDELNKNTLQAKIDTAIKAANKNQTPWFAGEYIYEVVSDELRGMAQCDAEDAFYPSPDERIIRI